MTRGRDVGERLTTALTAPLLVRSNPAPKTIIPPMQGHRFSRNGQHPDVGLINAINATANKSILYRTKEIFRAPGTATFPLAASGAGDRARWRFAFHTGPYAHMLKVAIGTIPQAHGGSPSAVAKSRLDISTSTSGSPVAASGSFTHGVNPGGSASTLTGWEGLKVGTMYISVDPDTDYYGTFYDVDYGRTMFACVWEVSSMTENHDGYLPQALATQSHIFSKYRQYPVTILNNLMKRGGATVLNWTVDNGASPITTTSSTATNIIDTSSTTISAATPGYTLDMTGKGRRIDETVSCVMKAYGSKSSSAPDGSVFLKDSAGTTIASIAGAFQNTAGWQTSGVFQMPAGIDKYDLQFSRAVAGTLSLYAVSIYEYGT